jgi:peptidoglycan hydrolase-like protein with peptidoglycan-binding domain
MGYITPADVRVSDNRAAHVARNSAEPGTDYMTAYGTDLRAPGSAVVIGADHSADGAEGRRLTFLMDNGEVIDWIHLSSIQVGLGTRVTGGQRGIALSGASGFGKDRHYGAPVHVTRRARRGLPFAQTLDFEAAIDHAPSGGSFPARDKYGDAWVQAAQRKLAAFGLYDGEIDGFDGQGTQSATRQLQALGDLDRDGVYGPDTDKLADLILAGRNATSRPNADIQAKVGSKPDGDFGPRTKLDVFVWQKSNGLEADAIWGSASDSKAFPAAPASTGGNPPFPLGAGEYFGPEGGPAESVSGYHGRGEGLALWQQQMKDRGWFIEVDGRFGPVGATSPQGETASVALGFQREKGLSPTAVVDRATWDAAWSAPVTPPQTSEPEPASPEPSPVPATNPAPTTPEAPTAEDPRVLVTPSAADFPTWIRYEEVLDPEGLRPDLNASALKYYGRPYAPVESHVHWWNTPGKGGTHDGNVRFIRDKDDVSVNYVVSEGRITLMVPLDKIALTTGARNPDGWKSENDPTLSDLQYRTMGYLHFIVEKRNPQLQGEAIRRHKEFMNTSCSEIDTARVRAYARQFAEGTLDPSTGQAPVPRPDVTEPTPEKAEVVSIDRESLRVFVAAATAALAS